MHDRLGNIEFLLACKLYDTSFSKGLIYLQENLVIVTVKLCTFKRTSPPTLTFTPQPFQEHVLTFQNLNI